MYVNKRFQVRIQITGFYWMSKGSANTASYFACVSMLQVNSSFHVFRYEPQNSRDSYHCTLCLCTTISVSVCGLERWHFWVQLYYLPLGLQWVVLHFLNLSDPLFPILFLSHCSHGIGENHEAEAELTGDLHLFGACLLLSPHYITV